MYISIQVRLLHKNPDSTTKPPYLVGRVVHATINKRCGLTTKSPCISLVTRGRL